MPDDTPRQNDQRILDKLDKHGEVLTRLDTKMESLIGNGGTKGRIPDLERTAEQHAASINAASGSLKTAMWFIGGIGLLLLTLGSLFVSHVLGSK